MNGNELNNMAQRYKEEMMRLYKKSSANQSGMTSQGAREAQPTAQQTQNNNMSMNVSAQRTAPAQMQDTAPMNITRDAAGTPIPGVPGASHYTLDESKDKGLPLPVTCECRFPSAESIIESIAGIPAHPIIRPEDNPPPVFPGESLIQPREENREINESPRMPAGTRHSDIDPNMGGTFSRADKTAYNRSTDETPLKGIMLNSSAEGGVYTVPAEAENEREILPDFPLPRDSMESVPSTAGLTPSMSWISLTGDNSWGYLQFEVFTAGGAYPVPGAAVIVKKQLPAGVGLVRVLFSDRSGRTPTIALPAPSASLSQNPMNTARPFSEYSVTVRAKGFYTLRDIKIPIFAGVKTVQPIDLIPLPEYSGGSQIQPRSDMQMNPTNNTNSVG